MGDALFGLLTGGASFDASRFRKDISAFEQSKEQQRDGPLDKFLAAQATASKRQAAGSENSPAGAWHAQFVRRVQRALVLQRVSCCLPAASCTQKLGAVALHHNVQIAMAGCVQSGIL